MELTIVDYHPEAKEQIKTILEELNWTDSQIEGQLKFLDKIDTSSERKAFIAKINDQVVGFISIEIHLWNNLIQIQGLATDLTQRRKGIASKLVEKVEMFARENKVRGIYVDTPVSNNVGRSFYESIGYNQDYIMTEYYDRGVDGVTYLKLFD